jgi:leucyl-tRNA---protein transferase
MRILRTFVTEPEECPYLPDREWRMKYQHLAELLPGEYEGRLLDGWFKYGAYLQRPFCIGCRECLSMRVPMDEFTLNRSQRRIIEKNANLEVRYGSPPICDEARVTLHNRYRASQFLERGWSPLHRSLESYFEEFVVGPSAMTEITIWEGTELRAVVLADVDKEAVAGVTHFWEPTLKHRSIGLFSMLQTFALAKHLEKKWVYLGYWVKGSPTMGYKLQFRPAELRSWDGVWKRFEPGEEP